ncbi:MAG: outer membrane beta-barrel protein [Gemmatimonadota bacterium]|nr:MAG: outer membrane beta-barrel protein [Gemmatimonadota bacterium]
MHRLYQLLSSLVILVFAPTLLAGQNNAIVLFGYGGRDLPLSNLNETGDHFGSDWVVGGGVGLQLNTNFAVRGTFSTVNSGWEGTSIELSDSTFRRSFVAFDLQAGVPTASGFVPYFVVGAGWFSIEPKDPDLEGDRSFAGRFGAGVNYVFDNTFMAFFLEGDTWIYYVDGLSYSRIQYDIMIVGGIAIAIPF